MSSHLQKAEHLLSFFAVNPMESVHHRLREALDLLGIKQQRLECKPNHLLSKSSSSVSGHESSTEKSKEDERSHDSSSFAFIQLCSLAISCVLLCLLPLLSNNNQHERHRQQTITAVALIAAAPASRIALEAIPRRPDFARRCGVFAIISLVLGLASLLTSFITA